MDKNPIKNQYGKPHFLGIGAPKTATTWLSHCFSKHSQIYIPPIEEQTYEVHYFDRCQSTTASFLRSCFQKLPQYMKETIKGTRVEHPYFTILNLWWRLPPQSALFVLFHLLTLEHY